MTIVTFESQYLSIVIGSRTYTFSSFRIHNSSQENFEILEQKRPDISEKQILLRKNLAESRFSGQQPVSNELKTLRQ